VKRSTFPNDGMQKWDGNVIRVEEHQLIILILMWDVVLIKGSPSKPWKRKIAQGSASTINCRPALV